MRDAGTLKGNTMHSLGVNKSSIIFGLQAETLALAYIVKNAAGICCRPTYPHACERRGGVAATKTVMTRYITNRFLFGARRVCGMHSGNWSHATVLWKAYLSHTVIRWLLTSRGTRSYSEGCMLFLEEVINNKALHYWRSLLVSFACPVACSFVWE